MEEELGCDDKFRAWMCVAIFGGRLLDDVEAISLKVVACLVCFCMSRRALLSRKTEKIQYSGIRD